MNIVKKIDPNRDVIALSKYDGLLRRNGYTPAQQMAIKRMVWEERKEADWDLCQRIPLLLIGLFVNVLHGNKYMSKKKIAAATEEVCELFSEVDLGLLDFDDVMNYNKNEVGMFVELQHEELVKNYKDPNPNIYKFKISEMKSHQERLRSVLEAKEAKLNEYVAADDNDDEAYAQLRLLEVLKRDFEKEGLL